MSQDPAATSLDCLFRPRSVAVVGASKRKHTIGREVLQNLMRDEFAGVVYPVNPGSPIVQSMRAFASVEEIDGEVDLAVLVVPGPQVLEVVEGCGKKGVKALVVISAGFGETGPEGAAREKELVAIARRYGMRVIGPNCMGIIHTDPAVRLNASFAAAVPIPGAAAFVSQSGALGEAILAQARQLGLGISMFASLGNRCDVDIADLIAYWEHDPRSKIILLYIESVGSPEKFVKIARRVSRTKPIVVVKSGRSRRGALAAASHTGALAGRDQAFDALFEQAGVLRVETLKELFDVASVYLNQPLPRGERIAIVSNAGGPAILATDACEGHGMPFAELSAETKAALRAALPPEASVANPVDLIASADAKAYDLSLRAVLADEHVDAAIVIFVSPVMIDAEAVARVIVERAREAGKTVVACLLGKQRGEEALQVLREGGIPVYPFPEEAARAVAALLRYRRRQERATKNAERRASRGDAEADPGSAARAAAVAEHLASIAVPESGWLELGDALELVRRAGLDVLPHVFARTPGDAVSAAHDLGYPTVVKLSSAQVLHKTEVGGVKVDLRTGDEVLSAARALLERARPLDPDARLLVQPMVKGAHEVILGGVRDPQFGPLVLFGLGGIFVEVMGDIALRIAPLERSEALEMIRSLRGLPLLEGSRGQKAVDFEALTTALVRVAALLAEHPEILELDLNPVLVGGSRAACAVVDARVRIAR
ncbi:MAG: acetate--CoA ligase family protein [Planctomycetes bacterium]|nr:acetate--CoA ligase family protein [Planctomycetota bacterium]